MDTTLAPTRPAAAELERPAPTARRLAESSISPNTRRAYSGVLGRLDAWLDGRPLADATLAAYLAELHDQGPGDGERGDGGGRGVLPGPPRRRPDPGRETDSPGPRRLPADGRQSRTGAGATVQGGGPRSRPRHLPPAAPARPRPRVRGDRPRPHPPTTWTRPRPGSPAS